MSLLFSGCLGLFEDDPEVDDGDDGTDADGGNGNQTADGNQTDDGDKTDDGNGNGDDNTTAETPEASLSANVTSGSAPLSVEFELDNDNDAAESVSWSLDLGEGDPETGDELPATVEHTYEDVGNYTVVLTLTSGDEEDTAEVTITVEEGGGAGNAVQEGTNGHCLHYNVLYLIPGGSLEGLAISTVDVDPGTGIELHSDDGTPYVDFIDGEGNNVGYYPSEGVDTVPDDAAFGVVCVTLEEGPAYPGIPAPAAAWTYQDGF